MAALIGLAWGLVLSQRVKELEDQNTTLSREKNDLERRVKELEDQNTTLSREKNDLERREQRLVYENTTLSREKNDLERREQRLVYENTKLSNEKRRAAYVSSIKILTLENRVWELEHQNIKLSSELVRQREDTRMVGLMFMNSADRYQQVAEKQIRSKEEELANMRKASLQLMNAADTYQEVARKQIKAKVDDLEDARKVILMIMTAADTYQIVAEKKIKDKVEELRVLGVHKAEIDVRAASLESRLEATLAKNQELEANYGNALIENDRLWSEVDRFTTGVERLNDEKNSVHKALDVEKVEACKLEELENYKSEKDGETEKLKAPLEEKKSEIDVLSKDNELLHLAVAKAQEKNKGSILSCLSPCSPK